MFVALPKRRKIRAILNFDTSCKEVEVPDGKYLKKVTILKPIAEADAVINLCKLKTHGMMVLTAAVKNMFGAIPGPTNLSITSGCQIMMHLRIA